MNYQVANLPYDLSKLSEIIGPQEIHFEKHHKGYATKLNTALEAHPEIDKNVTELLKDISSLPQDIQTVVRNNGGGFVNHNLFWQIMNPENGGGEPKGKVLDSINLSFGSFEKFKEEFSTKALNLFGSGWTWLVKTPDAKISIITTPNQDSPLMQNLPPILGLDVWEHAYYLKFQNRRAEYIEAWWNVVNWPVVEELL